MEYSQINEDIRFLVDIRFKLHALIPALGSAAVSILSKVGVSDGLESAPSEFVLGVVVLVSMVGFLVIFGVAIYDQRNSGLYNNHLLRAKYLER